MSRVLKINDCAVISSRAFFNGYIFQALDQIFVIIKLVDHDARPGSLFICPEGRPTEKIALPAPRSGRIQLLFDTESPILRGLRNIDTEVFLR